MEEKLAPYITARFVISYQPHPSLIEELILIVEGPGWDNKEKEALLEKIKSIIGTTPRPKQLYFMASFPETETGKIQRSALREACWKAFNLNQVK
jgi:acyl-coenzyme A synthetase/AMP-(fatty) acid ligase